jgi:hypothetical protein
MPENEPRWNSRVSSAGWSFEGVGNPSVTIVYTFESSGERTEMASDFDFRPKGVW